MGIFFSSVKYFERMRKRFSLYRESLTVISNKFPFKGTSSRDILLLVLHASDSPEFEMTIRADGKPRKKSRERFVRSRLHELNPDKQ